MQKVLLAVAVATLTACGGGGSSSSPIPAPSPATNAAPQTSDAIITDVNGGLVKPGDVLSFAYTYSDAENDAEGESRIQWLLNNEVITGTGANEYSVLAGQEGQQISARIIPVALTGETEGVAANSNALTVAIDGAPSAENLQVQSSQDRFKPGAELTASYDYTDAENDSENTSEAGTQYRWLRNGEAISGAATKVYTLTTADEGQSLTFEVTPAAVSGTLQGPAFLSTVIQVEANAAPVASDLRIDDENGGDARLGDLLIGDYQYSDAENNAQGTSKFKWLRDGVAITGATSLNYTVTSADQGQSLTFEVIPVALSGTLQGPAFLSAVMQIEANAAPVASAVKIIGSNAGEVKEGDMLTGQYVYSDADDAEGTSQYRWLRNGIAIANAQQLTYTLQKDDAGENVSFQVTPYAATGITAGVAKTSSTLMINSLPKLIDLSLNVSEAFSGERISVTQTYQDNENDAAGVHKYQWYRDGVAVSQAYRYYTLTNDDAGKTITVKVTPIAKTGSIEGYQVNIPGSVVVNSNTPPEARNFIITDVNGGDLHPGDTLTATYTYYDADGDLEDNSPTGTLVSWSYSTSNSGGYIPAGRGKASYVVEGKYLSGRVASSVTVKAVTGAKQGVSLSSDYMAVVAPDITAPVLTQQVAVSTPTYEKTVAYTFNSTEAGVLAISGKCTPADTSSVIAGNNTLNYGPLKSDTYDDCALTVTDAAGNESESLSIAAFEIQIPAPVNLTLLVGGSDTLIQKTEGDDVELLSSRASDCTFSTVDQCNLGQIFEADNDNIIAAAITTVDKGYLKARRDDIESSKDTRVINKLPKTLSRHKAIVFDNKLWLFGLYIYEGDDKFSVWNTENGIDWQKVDFSFENNKPDRMRARDFDMYVWNGSLFMLGGFGGHGTTYSSVDGVRWVDRGFIGYHAREPRVINNGDHLLMVGGYIHDFEDSGAQRSEDGVNWTRVGGGNSHSWFTDANKQQALRRDDGTLFIMGGTDLKFNRAINNVFYSTNNGISWSNGVSLPQPMNLHRAVFFNNKIWVFYYHGVYSLALGATDWTQETTDFPGRYQGYEITEFKGKLWMTGGYRHGDIIYTSENGTDWRQFQHATLTFPE